MISISCCAKARFLVRLLLEIAHPRATLVKNKSACLKRGIARAVRPAIGHAQHILNWWVRPVAWSIILPSL